MSRTGKADEGCSKEDMEWTDCFVPHTKGDLKVKLKVREK